MNDFKKTPNDQRLEQVLATYLHAVEAGQSPDREQIIAAHPDLAAELRSFFANRAAMERLAEPLRGAAVEPTIVSTSNGSTDESLRVRYFGDYELLTELGRGGMGVVYKARQTTLNRLVALKMILAGQLAGTEDVLRFKQEAEAAANLDHPNIAPIYETGEHEGRHYFSMKLIEGGCLRDALPNLRNEVPVGVKLLSKVARAVHHAHQRGVLHRDLKPANVLLDQDGTPYVTDFGLAKRVERGSDITRTGAIVGTPSYMAPEQARAEKLLTTAVDVYSLGAILYELLAGQPPFRADSALETLLQVASHEARRPSAFNPRADRDLETVAMKCLEKDTAKRYDSAAAFADELDRWLRGEPIAARPTGNVERMWRWCRRNPVIAGLITATAVSLVAGILVSRYFAVEAASQAKAERKQREYAETETQRANQEQLRAERQTRQATAQRLAVESREALREFPQRSLLLAVEAMRATMTFDEPVAPVAQQILRDALATVGGKPLGRHLSPGGALGPHIAHPGPIFVSPERLLVVGGMLPTLWSYGQEGPILERRFVGCQSEITCWLHVKQREQLLVGTEDGLIRIWNLNATHDPQLRELQGHTTPVSHLVLAADGNRLLSASKDGALCVWNLEQRPTRPIHVFREIPGPLRELVVSPDGRWVAASNAPRKARLWNLGVANQAPTSQEIHGEHRLQFCPDNRWLAAAGGREGRAGLWDVRENPVAKFIDLRTERGFSTTALLSPNGRWLTTDNAGGDGIIRLWNLSVDDPSESPILLKTKIAITNAPGFRFSQDSRWLAVSSNASTVYLWDLASDLPIAAPVELSLDFAVDRIVGVDVEQRMLISERLLSANAYQVSLRKFGPNGFQDPPLNFAGHEKSVTCWAMSPAADRLATGSDDRTIRVWDLVGKPPSEPLVLRGHEGRISSVAFNSKGNTLISASEDGTARYWDIAGRHQAASPRPLAGYGEEGQAPTHTGERWLTRISGQLSGRTVRLWDMQRSTTEPVLSQETTRLPLATAVSSNGRVLAVSCYARNGGLIQVFQRADDEPFTNSIELSGHHTDVTNVWLSPDGRWLCATYVTPALYVWDLARVPLDSASFILKYPGDRIDSVDFSADSRWLMTRGSSVSSLWDLRVERLEKSRIDFESPHRFHAFVPGQLQCLTLDKDRRQLRVWDLSAVVPRVAASWDSASRIYTATAANGSLVLSCDDDTKVLSLTDLSLSPLVIPAAKPSHTRLSPNGRWLVTASNSVASLWDRLSQSPNDSQIVLRNHDANISSLEFSPNSRWLVTISISDSACWLWDLEAKDLAESGVQLRTPRESATRAVFTPDSRRLLISGPKWGTLEHRLDLRNLLDLAPTAAGRTLTNEERKLYGIDSHD